MELVVLMVASIMAAAAAMRGAQAVQFIAINNATTTPGGVRFDKEFGVAHGKYVLRRASLFVLKTFKQTQKERANVKGVTLIVEPSNGVAFTSDSKVHLSSDYIAGYKSGSVKTEIEGIIFHEVTHVWQWNGGGKTPTGLIEGIADFVRLKAGYAKAYWVKAGEGQRWDQGYDVTAKFLDYCDGLPRGNGSFIERLNRGMRSDYSEQLFVRLLGKTVGALWKDYKALYGH